MPSGGHRAVLHPVPLRSKDQARGPEPAGGQPAAGHRELRESNERVRNEIAEVAREPRLRRHRRQRSSAIRCSWGDEARARVFRAALRLSPSEQNDFDAIANILARADGVQRNWLSSTTSDAARRSVWLSSSASSARRRKALKPPKTS